MTGTQRARAVCDRLEQVYPDAVCALHYQKPYELMIAARLSAQCTDARVNIVTRTLFEKYPTLESFANAELTELEQDIRPCGFYHTKAQSIIGMCRRILEVYGGELPHTMEDLLTLLGIGRKTANLLMGDVYGKPAVVTDTHCIRICGRRSLLLFRSQLIQFLRDLIHNALALLFALRSAIFLQCIVPQRLHLPGPHYKHALAHRPLSGTGKIFL